MNTFDRKWIIDVGNPPDKGFRADLRARLCRDFAQPPHNLTPDLIAQRADALWLDAGRYGMRSRSDYARYSYLMMGYWDHWAQSPDAPWISNVLTRRDLSGTNKLDFIYATLETAG